MSLHPKRSTVSLIAFALMTMAASAATVPRPAPEFAITMPNGSQLLLSQYAGKVVLLEFLYTT